MRDKMTEIRTQNTEAATGGVLLKKMFPEIS